MCKLCSVSLLQAVLISLGRNWGTGYLGPVSLTGCFGYLPAKMKSKDLFKTKTRLELGIAATKMAVHA